MINILFFIESLSGGGAEKVLRDLVNAMDQTRFAITVQTLYPEDTGKYLAQGIRYRYCYPKASRWNDRRMRIEAALGLTYPLHIRDAYDIEVAYLECGATKIMAGSTNRQALKLAWVHCDLAKKAAQVDRFIRDTEKYYKTYDKVVCVSDDVRKSFEKMYGPSIETKTIYNCYDDAEILRKASASVCKESEPTVIAIGRLTAQKGFDILLRVHKRLVDDGLHYQLKILGEGPDRGQLEAFIEENTLRDSVTLCGFQNNPYPLLKSAAFYVCSSRYEGFSTTVIESLILGIPVVTTDCTGMREILGDSQYGLIAADGEDGLYEAMKRMLTDPQLLAHYREQAELRGKDFSCEKLVRATETFLEQEYLKKLESSHGH